MNRGPAELSSSMPAAARAEAIRLLLAFVRAMHIHGAPAHRLEREAGAVATRLGIQASFFSTPTMLLASFGDDDATAETHVLRVQPGAVNLGVLAELDALGAAMQAGALPIAEAQERARQLTVPRSLGSRWSLALAGGVASLSAAALMGGGAAELLTAGAIGVGQAALGLGGRRFEAMARLQLVLAGLLSASVAGAVATQTPLALTLVTVAGLISHVPGLSLTVAMTELATQHLASGSARTFDALTTLAQLAFGALVGAALAAHAGAPLIHTLAANEALPATAAGLAGGIAFARLLEARRADFPVVVAAAVAALWAARFGESTVGGVPGVALASTFVGVVGNAFARFRRQAASLVLIPGILMLVPGSLGFRSLAELLAGDVIAGVSMAVQVAMVAMALAAGQIVAHAVVPPRRAL